MQMTKMSRRDETTSLVVDCKGSGSQHLRVHIFFTWPSSQHAIILGSVLCFRTAINVEAI